MCWFNVKPLTIEALHIIRCSWSLFQCHRFSRTCPRPVPIWVAVVLIVHPTIVLEFNTSLYMHNSHNVCR